MGGWGDNGPARPATEEYKSNWDKIFGKKNEAKREDRESDKKLQDTKAVGDSNKTS